MSNMNNNTSATSGNKGSSWPYTTSRFDQNTANQATNRFPINNSPMSNGSSLYAACAAAMAAISSTWGNQKMMTTSQPQMNSPGKRGRKRQTPKQRDMGAFSPFYNAQSPRGRPSSKGTNQSSAQSSPLSPSMLTSKMFSANLSGGLMTPSTPDSAHSVSGWPSLQTNRQFDNILNVIEDIRPLNGSLQRVMKLIRQSNITKLITERLNRDDLTKLDQDRDILWLRMRAKYSKFKFTTFTDDLYVASSTYKEATSMDRPQRPKSSNAVLLSTKNRRRNNHHNSNSNNQALLLDSIVPSPLQTSCIDFQTRFKEEPLNLAPQNPFTFDHSKIISPYTASSGQHIPPPPFYSDFAGSFNQKSNLRLNNYTNPSQITGPPPFLGSNTNNNQASLMNFDGYPSTTPVGHNLPSGVGKQRMKKYHDDNGLPIHRPVNHQGNGELTGGSMKKCRARFGLEHQNLWCKPCRRKKKCIRFISEQDLEQQQENKLRGNQPANEKTSNFYMNDLLLRRQQQQHHQPKTPRQKKTSHQQVSPMDNSNFLTSAAAAFLRNTTTQSGAIQSNNGNNENYPLFSGMDATSSVQSASIGSMMAAMFDLNRPRQTANNSLMNQNDLLQSQNLPPTLTTTSTTPGFNLPMSSQDLLFNTSDISSEIKRRKLSNVFPNFMDDLGDNSGPISKLVAQ